MYIIRHKETKQRIGRHYSTAGTAKGAFKTAYLMYDKTQKKYLKFSEQDIYEVVKEETAEMVALEKAVRLLREAENLLRIASTSLGNLGDPSTEGKIDRFLESLDE